MSCSFSVFMLKSKKKTLPDAVGQASEMLIGQFAAKPRGPAPILRADWSVKPSVSSGTPLSSRPTPPLLPRQ